MLVHRLADGIGQLQGIDRVARPLADAVKRLVGHGSLKNALSGTWLGHPFHPLMTDVPIGSFTSAAVLDLLGGRRARPAADLLVAFGLASAAPTVASGAADWSETYGSDQRVGAVHALSNVVGLGLYGLSLLARLRGRRSAGVGLGFAGMASMTVGGYLGGHLGYSRGVGVNNTFFEHPPEEWTPVLGESSLAERQVARVEAGDASLLLYRCDGRIRAIGSRCSHAGGPLHEGAIDAGAGTVECPWHGSVFALEDGAVVRGPASVPQPAYDVRVDGGRVEVRRRLP